MLLRDSKGRFISPKSSNKYQAKPARQTTTYVGLCLDKSGSMRSIAQSALNFCNQLVQTIKNASIKNKQNTYLTLGTFSNTYSKAYSNIPIEHAPHLTEYYTGGGTALFDAFLETVRSLQQVDDGISSFLVYVCTDGEENQSRAKASEIKDLIQQLQRTDRWTFVFHVPTGYTKLADTFGISKDNIQSWVATEEGLNEALRNVQYSTQDYYSSRKMGTRSTKKFFVDMSKVNSSDINQLQDLTNNFKSLKVEAECDIKQFVESKTGKPYEPGSAYYELTKPETVQPYKDILVRKRGETRIYGGQEARDLLKLPNQDVKVNLQNLGQYQLFIKSTSVNRKLVRGTTLLLRK